jgi:hypothetical protein
MLEMACTPSTISSCKEIKSKTYLHIFAISGKLLKLPLLSPKETVICRGERKEVTTYIVDGLQRHL